MQIKCPHCSANYRIPDEVFQSMEPGMKQQKMRCHKCKSIFTCVFSVDDQPPDEPKPQAEQLENTQDQMFVPGLIPSSAVQENTPQDSSEDIFDRPAGSQMSYMDPSTQVNITVMAGGLSYRNKKLIVIAAIAVACIIAVVSLFLIDGSSKPSQTGAPKISSKDLEIVVDEGYELIIADGRPILVVTGMVTNNTDEPWSKIILQGGIIDTKGNLRYQTQAPCAVLTKKKKLKDTARGSFIQLYQRNGHYYNCRLRRGWKSKFQLVFDNIPPEFVDDYTVRVGVASAHNSASKKK